MIKNERQYRITKSQAVEFANALKRIENETATDMHPKLRQAQLAAVRSQYADLESALREYKSLQEQRPAVIEALSLDELPRALIRARIALGLSQKDLADKMGLKEQQVQRYEATEYTSASLARIREVAAALGVRVAENIFLPGYEPTRDALYARLDEAGIDADFLVGRLLPTDVVMGLQSDSREAEGRWVAHASEALKRIFGWSSEQLFGADPLAIEGAAVATARFKLPGGAHGRRLHAYIAYAHYLGLVVANACRDLPRAPLSLDAKTLREALIARDPSIGLEALLNFFWDHGVPVLPLSDSGAFHGACWRVAGRNVVVVKHRSRFLARWVFDLLHEWHHAGQAPNEESHSWIEEADLVSTRRTSPEEQAASQFAGNVLLDGRAEALVADCMKATKGDIPLFKSAAPRIAQQAGVVVDHFANYLAWRLSLQQENWWGTANNLQTQVGDPFSVAREVFYRRFDFQRIDPVDARLLERALRREGEYE
jgi:transcriptional regulator with XRE-family HTH domain